MILGYGKGELAGMNYRKLLDGETAQAVPKTFARVLPDGQTGKGENGV